MATERILASPDLSVVQPRSFEGATVFADYWALTKPDVNFLIVITTAAAFYTAWPQALSDLPWALLLHTLLGTGLVASGAAALNQWMERDFDARMRRTARRPIAAGRIEPAHARTFGAILSLAGLAYLLFGVGTLAALLAGLTLLSYLFVYTPLKRKTPLSIVIGAVPGATPPLIGWAAARERLDPEALVLFAVVFLWQLPHFMAIAWMYRDDYDRAGYVVLPRGHSRARFVTVQTLLPLVALLPVSLVPVLPGEPSSVYMIGALLLDLAFLSYGAQFALRKSGATARQLLMASIIYLFALFVLLAMARGLA